MGVRLLRTMGADNVFWSAGRASDAMRDVSAHGTDGGTDDVQALGACLLAPCEEAADGASTVLLLDSIVAVRGGGEGKQMLG